MDGMSVKRPLLRWEDDKKKKKNCVLRTAISLPGERFVAYFKQRLCTM